LKVLFYTLVIVIIDQVTKLWIKGFSIPALNFNHEGMYHGQRIDVLGDFFRITFIENPGMAFGIDPGSELKIYFSLFSLIASIGLVIYLYYHRREKFIIRFSLAFILGGAIGNLIDRMFYGVFYGYAPLFYGKVVDFLDFNFFDVTIFGRSYERFPIFNIADSAVTVGVVLLLLFYNKHHSSNKSKEDIPETTAVDYPQDENNTPVDEETEMRNRDENEPDNGKELPL
jgi:signal peptidase II